MPGFGYAPFGRRPFSTIGDLPLPAATATAAIAAGIIFTVEIYPISGSAIYAATEQYNTMATDTLSNTPFNGTVEKALRFHRAIIDGRRIGGFSSGYADLELSNYSGDYDGYAAVPLDGARVVVRMGRSGQSFNSFATLYDGIAEGNAKISEESLTLTLQDDNERLNIPVQPHVYGGTGGTDGDSNVTGKRKPLALGQPVNVSPVLINAASLVYQIHDGQITGISHVYDRGVELTANATPDYADYAALTAASITAGRWASCLALGLIRLASKPDGIVTATLSGGAVSNGLVAGLATGTALTDTASIVHYLITISTATIVVDMGSIIAARAAQGATIGYFVGPDDDKTLRGAIDELMGGILGWAGFRRDRSFELGLIALPTASVPLGDYTDKDFFELKKIALPSQMDPPPYRIRAAYAVNWTVQPELAAAVDVTTATLRKDRYAVASSTNTVLSAAIQAAHLKAQDPEVWPSFFALSADAVTFCNATLTLFGGAARGLYEITLPADAYALNLANPILVTDDRYELDSGATLAIVSIDDDTTEEQAILQAFG